MTPDGKTLYVSNEDAAQTSVVDLATGTVRKAIDVGKEPEGVAVRPDGKVVYVTSESSSEVDVIDTSTDQVVARIPTQARPRAVVFSRDGQRALITTEAGATVHLVDAAAHKVLADIHVTDKGARPMGIALSPDGVHAYVTNGRGGSISVIDVAPAAISRSIRERRAPPVGHRRLPRRQDALRRWRLLQRARHRRRGHGHDAGQGPRRHGPLGRRRGECAESLIRRRIPASRP